MTLPLIVHPEGEVDLAQARRWYEQRREGLGDDFILCVEGVFDRLRKTPELSAKVFQDVRLALVRRFPAGWPPEAGAVCLSSSKGVAVLLGMRVLGCGLNGCAP